MKRVLFFITFLLSSISFSQSDKQLEEQGDVSMQNGLYTYAVHYYSFILYKIKEDQEAMYYAYDITAEYDQPETNSEGAVKPPVDPSNKEIRLIHKLGEAYLKSNDYINAEEWFSVAVKYPKDQFPYSRYFYGLSLMKNYKYDEAIEQFELFISENGNPTNRFYKLAQSKIVNCEFAKNPENNSTKLYITNLDSTVNFGSTSFGIQFYSEEYMIFSAALPDTSQIYESEALKDYLLDLYLVKLDGEGNFVSAELFPYSINTPDWHEGSASISPDGNILYYTSSNPLNKNETVIYRTKKMNGQWMQPQAMGQEVNAPGFRSMNPYISRDGKQLYFSSNRPGGEGGMDIWMVDMDAEGNATHLQNMGVYINTADDEISPFYHEQTKSLFFASAGHIGFGGLDIFEAKWNNNNDWFGEPINIGAPANSSRDDSYYILDKESKIGYLTSDREICEECDTVYNLKRFCNKIYQIKTPEIEFMVKGYVYDDDSGDPIPNATVEFKDITYKWQHFSIQTDENGYYEHVLIPNVEVFMKATMKDYFADQGLVSNVGVTVSEVYEQDFYLQKIPQGEIAIEGIEYDFDSADLRPESKIILDKVVEFLELNSNISVEIRSHTDQRGNDNYNLRLSERRAKSVVDYLISKGIDPDRLQPKGLGETEPAEVPNTNGEMVSLTPEYISSLPNKDEQEKAHQKNRRTAFKVINN